MEGRPRRGLQNPEGAEDQIRRRQERLSSRTFARGCWPPRSFPTRRVSCWLREAAKEYHWNLNYGGIALVWRAGCIIRSAFLGDIKKAYDANPTSPTCCSINTSAACSSVARRPGAAWGQGRRGGRSHPGFTTALAFYDGYRSARLPANLLQAHRDYFGGPHLRARRPAAASSSTRNWTGKGGNVAAGRT